MLNCERIKEMRLEKGLSQQELGDAIGVTKVSICGYENGTRTPSLETLVLLSDFFQISSDYLLGRISDKVIDEKNVERLTSNEYEIINELRNFKNLYCKIIKDPRRYISLVYKKLK